MKADTSFTIPRMVKGWVDLIGWFAWQDNLLACRWAQQC